MISDFLINKVYAQAICNPLSPDCNGSSGINNLGQLIQCVIVYFAKYIAPPIAVIAILYGAFMMLTSGGDPEKFSTGRKIILYAIIGYVVVLVATGLVAVVLSVLGTGAAAAATCPIF